VELWHRTFVDDQSSLGVFPVGENRANLRVTVGAPAEASRTAP
jgi:hypothetical protein